ncbi:cell division protein FtsQ/DivIB [Luteimonas lutimaris]|uniref:Cell division protein FtsQ n=1 Tax=Luteimonas lutimaris TaxID=698645 RepID=A0ABP7N2A8_9GAMM|nr:cell division protein FtsQ/DivIB [Luteimonas sp.]
MSAFLRLVAWLLALALVALPVVAVLQGWIGAERWPLRTLRVVGTLDRVDEQKLREAVLPYARNGFFAVRLEDAQAAVAKLPWVERAEVRKRWPDVVEVRIVEHRPFARWGKDQLLSEDGDLFPVAGAEVPSSLPQFDVDAPAARIADVVALYNEANAMFASEGVRVHEVSLDRRGSWSLLLSSGTRVVVGSQEARLRLARFARLMPTLLAQNPLPLSRADLRYTNGFALTWGEETEAGNGKPRAGGARSPQRQVLRFPEQRRGAPVLAAVPDSRFRLPGISRFPLPTPGFQT